MTGAKATDYLAYRQAQGKEDYPSSHHQKRRPRVWDNGFTVEDRRFGRRRASLVKTQGSGIRRKET